MLQGPDTESLQLPCPVLAVGAVSDRRYTADQVCLFLMECIHDNIVTWSVSDASLSCISTIEPCMHEGCIQGNLQWCSDVSCHAQQIVRTCPTAPSDADLSWTLHQVMRQILNGHACMHK